MDTITRVWIDDGCISCHACVGTAPDVFAIPDADGAVILAEVRVDGISSRNVQERSLLNAVGLEYHDLIVEAAAGCPIEIIRFDQAPAGGNRPCPT